MGLHHQKKFSAFIVTSDMNGLAVFGTMQSQAFNVCGQALLHDEHSWRAVGMCSLAAKDPNLRAQGDMLCERN